jgi:long-chain fatty acid transport protein
MAFLRYVAFCFVLLVVLLPDVSGSGFTFDGLGVKARGMGGAFRALADDWSAAYYNPAGYNRIRDNVLATNVAFLNDRFAVDLNAYRGGNEELESGFINGREIYNAHAILNIPQGAVLARFPVAGDEMVLGLSILQIFDQNQSWELYRNIKAYNRAELPRKQFYNNLDVVAFQLTAARGFMDDRLSVGVGLALLRGDLIYNSVIFRANPYTDETIPILRQLSDRPADRVPQWFSNNGNGLGFGYRVGLLYGLSDNVDVALVYDGSTSINISGQNQSIFYLSDNPTLASSDVYFDTTEEHYFVEGVIEDVYSDFETTLELPSSIAGGISTRLGERLILALDAEITFWSNFKGFEFKYSNFSSLPRQSFTRARALMTSNYSIAANWDDAARIMVGANYRLNDFTDLRAGLGFDQSPVTKETFVPQFMDLGDKFSYSAGVGFAVGFWHLDVSGVYTHQKDLDLSQMPRFSDDGLMENLPGAYSADNYETILGLSYRF